MYKKIHTHNSSNGNNYMFIFLMIPGVVFFLVLVALFSINYKDKTDHQSEVSKTEITSEKASESVLGTEKLDR